MKKQNFKLNTTLNKISPSGIRKFFELVIGMKDVISLGVGEPDFVTPWSIRESAVFALEKGYTSYTSNYGLIELREAVCLDFKKKYKVSYSPQKETLITVGVSEGVDIALRAVLNKGDEVIIFEPSYVSYEPMILLAGGKPVSVSLDARNGFKPNINDLEKKITTRTKVLFLNYPNNPTGVTFSKKELAQISKIAVKRGLIVISDEIYADLTYDVEHFSISSFPNMKNRTIVLNGFSKNYAMTGFRIGYSLAPEEITAAMLKIHQYSMMCAPILSQIAAVEALKNGESEKNKMINEYKKRRNFFVAQMNEIGLECFLPQGAFYAFPSVKSTGLTSEEFALRLLEKHKVAVVPGNAFGKNGEGYVRCSYANSIDKLRLAAQKIKKFLKEI